MLQKKIKNDRRRGPDILIKWINYLSIFSWLVMFIVFVIVSIAKPPVEGFFDRQYNIKVSAAWDRTLLDYSFYMILFLLIICAMGLLINSFRLQRATDKLNRSLLFFFVLSIIGILYHVFFL